MNEQQITDRLTLVDSVQSVLAAIYQDRTKLTDIQVKQFAPKRDDLQGRTGAGEAGIVDTIADPEDPRRQTPRGCCSRTDAAPGRPWNGRCIGRSDPFAATRMPPHG